MADMRAGCGPLLAGEEVLSAPVEREVPEPDPAHVRAEPATVPAESVGLR